MASGRYGYDLFDATWLAQQDGGIFQADRSVMRLFTADVDIHGSAAHTTAQLRQTVAAFARSDARRHPIVGLAIVDLRNTPSELTFRSRLSILCYFIM